MVEPKDVSVVKSEQG